MSNQNPEIVQEENVTEVSSNEIVNLIEKRMINIREDLRDNPYINEAIRVLQVNGYRSAIGAFWNAVVDDLRKKIMHRSLELFNKEMGDRFRGTVNSYEDFQDMINDDVLIEGAYKIGVIGWEANKILRHAKETRHIFSGHPKSSEPSVIKVLGMMEDCIKYVLNEDYPPQIIDIDEYISIMATEEFDRNAMIIENAFGDLPDRYKNELINRLYTSYISPDCSTILRSNIEFCTPILWNILTRDNKYQVARRTDRIITDGNANKIKFAFSFLDVVDGFKYLSVTAKKYKIEPLIKELSDSLDVWKVENRCVTELERYAAYVPSDLLDEYVNSLTQTYVGKIGNSFQFSRTDFYADGAALFIPDMFYKFDDTAADAFIKALKNNKVLKRRINNPTKLRRLRSLGNIVLERVSENYHEKELLEMLIDEKNEKEFLEEI